MQNKKPGLLAGISEVTCGEGSVLIQISQRFSGCIDRTRAVARHTTSFDVNG
jgi:hypothetical protein